MTTLHNALLIPSSQVLQRLKKKKSNMIIQNFQLFENNTGVFLKSVPLAISNCICRGGIFENVTYSSAQRIVCLRRLYFSSVRVPGQQRR